MTTGAAGKPAPSAGAGEAGRARQLGRWLTRWWFRAPGGRVVYQRRRADVLVAAAGLGVVVVCGVLVAALPLVAAAAALLRRLRLAAALAAATLLKVSLESVAKMFVQRDRPAEAFPHVILRGNSAARGLSFPSGHAMVIFAIAVLVTPYFKGWWKALPWALAAAVCLSRVYLGAHFPLDVIAGAGLGTFIGGVLNLVFGVPRASLTTARADQGELGEEPAR